MYCCPSAEASSFCQKMKLHCTNCCTPSSFQTSLRIAGDASVSKQSHHLHSPLIIIHLIHLIAIIAIITINVIVTKATD